MLQSTSDFFSEQLAALSAYLSRQPVVLTVFLIACAIALLALALFLCGAKRGLEKQQRLHECRRHFDDDDEFSACEKVPGPAHGESLWSETRREFGLKGSHAQGANLKPDLPLFHVSGHSATIVQPCFVSTISPPS